MRQRRGHIRGRGAKRQRGLVIDHRRLERRKAGAGVAAALEGGQRAFGLAGGGGDFIQLARDGRVCAKVLPLLLRDIRLPDRVDRGLQAFAFLAHDTAGAGRCAGDPDHANGHKDRQHRHQEPQTGTARIGLLIRRQHQEKDRGPQQPYSA